MNRIGKIVAHLPFAAALLLSGEALAQERRPLPCVEEWNAYQGRLASREYVRSRSREYEQAWNAAKAEHDLIEGDYLKAAERWVERKLAKEKGTAKELVETEARLKTAKISMGAKLINYQLYNEMARDDNARVDEAERSYRDCLTLRGFRSGVDLSSPDKATPAGDITDREIDEAAERTRRRKQDEDPSSAVLPSAEPRAVPPLPAVTPAPQSPELSREARNRPPLTDAEIDALQLPPRVDTPVPGPADRSRTAAVPPAPLPPQPLPPPDLANAPANTPSPTTPISPVSRICYQSANGTTCEYTRERMCRSSQGKFGMTPCSQCRPGECTDWTSPTQTMVCPAPLKSIDQCKPATCTEAVIRAGGAAQLFNCTPVATGLKSAVLPVEPLPPPGLSHPPAVLPPAALPPPQLAATPREPPHAQPKARKQVKKTAPSQRRVNRREPAPQGEHIDPAAAAAVIGIIGAIAGGAASRPRSAPRPGH